MAESGSAYNFADRKIIEPLWLVSLSGTKQKRLHHGKRFCLVRGAGIEPALLLGTAF
jgi:hypothetical protein